MSIFKNKRKDYSIQPPKQLVPAGGFSVTDSSNINFTYFNNDLTADLTLTGVVAGTYGSSTQVPVLQIDQWGRVTGVTIQTIPLLTLKTNGVVNANQTLLNLVAGTNMTITDDGLGNITFDAAGSSGGVTAVTATAPLTSSGGTTPDISTSMNTNKLIGRGTAGVGVMEEITLGTNLSLSGTTLNATSGGILHGTASGTDTYTVTITGAGPYTDGDAYLIRFTNGNTTTSTLNINGQGPITLYRNNDGALIGGDIIAGSEMLCVYNSTTNRFQVIGTAPNTLLGYVTNADSVSITKGQVVYAFGGQGDRMTVKLANNTSDATSARTVGVVLSTSIGVNQKGLIMMQGLLDGLSILPTATYNDGDPIYLGSTPGSITKVKPYAPNHLVYVATVTTASNGSAGRMYVNIQNGYELDELHNVQAQSPSLKDTLWYDNTVTPAQWKTASIATILGYTPLSQTLANTNIFVGNVSNIATAVAMSGDATLANTGALTISNNAVTYAKMQNVSTTSRLLGSSSTTTPVQEIILGTGLSMSGNTLNATSSSNSIGELTGDVTAGPASSPSQSVAATVKANLKVGSCGVTFDGQGGVISNGRTAYVQIPYSGTLIGWTLVAAQSGSCTITVFKDTYANFPPISPADNIYTVQPSLSSAIRNQNLTPTYIGSQATVTAGDYIGFTISGVSTVSWVNLTIQINKT